MSIPFEKESSRWGGKGQELKRGGGLTGIKLCINLMMCINIQNID